MFDLCANSGGGEKLYFCSLLGATPHLPPGYAIVQGAQHIGKTGLLSTAVLLRCTVPEYIEETWPANDCFQ